MRNEIVNYQETTASMMFANQDYADTQESGNTNTNLAASLFNQASLNQQN